MESPRPRFRHRRLLPLLLLPIIFLFRRTPTPPPPAAPTPLLLSLSVGANASIAAHLRSLTRRPHLAGTPDAVAAVVYVLSHLHRAGLETRTADFSALLSYPSSAFLSLLNSNRSLVKKLSLAEPADAEAVSVQPYHAYSPSDDTGLGRCKCW